MGATTGHMTARDDAKQPLDHLPPAEVRNDAQGNDDAPFPDAGGPAGASPVSPETAAEPEKPDRHGVDKLLPADR